MKLGIRTDDYVTNQDGLITLDEINTLHHHKNDSYTGDGITIGVVDSGVDKSHPIFDGVDVRQVDVVGSGVGDSHGHGTAVAGTIARIAPDAKIIMFKALNENGYLEPDNIKNVYWDIIEKATALDIVNLSLGALEKIEPIDALHNKMVEAGIQDIVAAGNTGSDGGSPATAKKAFSVGALNEKGEPARFSSYNPKWENPDISALGKNIKLPRASGTSMGEVINDDWVKSSGTSFSAPITTGFMARYMERFGEKGREAFLATADDLKGYEKDGQGILNYGAAVALTSHPSAAATSWQFAGNDITYINKDWLPSGKYRAELVEDKESEKTIRFDLD